MKYSDNKFDSNYDELENSIIDSLSEISIASNLPVNAHNQDLVNRTISEVISTYLWSNDSFPGKYQQYDEDSVKKNRSFEKNKHMPFDSDSKLSEKNPVKKITSQVILSPDEISDDSIKLSPKKLMMQKNPQQLIVGSNVNDKNKFTIPVLDLSYLQDNKTKADEQHNRYDEIGAKKEKNKSRLSGETAITSTKHESRLTNDMSKSRNAEQQNFNSFKKIEFVNSQSVKTEIELLLKELRLNKNVSSDLNEYYDQENESKLNKYEYEKLNSMAYNLKELLSRLLEKRKISKRNKSVEKMHREETQAEKIDTQKELLTFEERHGRPQTKLEKDLMRPLYDHYRKVKRLLAKNPQLKNQMSDDYNEDEKDQKYFVNLHSLTISELLKERDASVIEKIKLKDIIKKYEIEFTKINGRQLNKEDREYHKEEFERYKVLKAKLKLIDALIEKHESNKKN